MKIKCPKNQTHKEFSATAHVTEDWKVDGNGNFIKVLNTNDSTTVHYPDPDDLFVCLICGSQAIAENE